MAAVAHNPSFSKKVGVPQKVGKEFNAADQMSRAKALRKPKAKASRMPAMVPDTDGDGY